MSKQDAFMLAAIEAAVEQGGYFPVGRKSFLLRVSNMNFLAVADTADWKIILADNSPHPFHTLRRVLTDRTLLTDWLRLECRDDVLHTVKVNLKENTACFKHYKACGTGVAGLKRVKEMSEAVFFDLCRYLFISIDGVKL